MRCNLLLGPVANIKRLILYFPVSALVTLFGNILQNPQDPRARSDVRLMNLVVNFLSMLSADEENGGVKRMLGVCAEFERIAKVVLDKAEREAPRRKRKNPEEPKTKGPSQNSLAPSQVQMMDHSPTPMVGVYSPDMNSQNEVSPMDSSGSPNSGQWHGDFANGNGYMTPNGAVISTFSDLQGYVNAMETNSSLDPNNFQQPFVPQDLWQMPMTLEWDWANMTSGAYPGFENGLVDDTSLQNDSQPSQHQL